MYGIQYFGEPPVKNKDFRLFFRVYKDTVSPPQIPETSLGSWIIGVSQNGNPLVPPTNTPVGIVNNVGSYDAGGWYYLDLTASEMNTDYLCVGINESNRVIQANAIVIKTRTPEGDFFIA
jgi:hypothetical protein